jgi:hypothetical protein
VAILQTLQKTASANAKVAATRAGDELSRRFQECVRSALPRSGDIAARELENYLSAVRRIELLDARTRGQPEPRKVLRKVQQLEIAVAVLCAGKK